MTTQLVMEEDSGCPLERQLLGELPRVRAFLSRLLSGRPELEVEDLVQETVARALRYRATFDPRRALGPWLRKTAFRVFLDQQRRSQPVDADAVPEPESTPAENEGRLEQRETVTRLLERLPAREREILLRFHRDEQPLSQIASELGLPLGTVKSHLHRSRKRFAEDENR